MFRLVVGLSFFFVPPHTTHTRITTSHTWVSYHTESHSKCAVARISTCILGQFARLFSRDFPPLSHPPMCYGLSPDQVFPTTAFHLRFSPERLSPSSFPLLRCDFPPSPRARFLLSALRGEPSPFPQAAFELSPLRDATFPRRGNFPPLTLLSPTSSTQPSSS